MDSVDAIEDEDDEDAMLQEAIRVRPSRYQRGEAAMTRGPPSELAADACASSPLDPSYSSRRRPRVNRPSVVRPG